MVLEGYQMYGTVKLLVSNSNGNGGSGKVDGRSLELLLAIHELAASDAILLRLETSC